ncbi:hypothetical protein V6N12_023808 [Hibiscus sabdariffa]|uniref:Uncharacterized protein n=1 Tax=Hibiscus sabdariffa TaxID=183260 RepID=A0ABR2FZP0_9ROSI
MYSDQNDDHYARNLNDRCRVHPKPELLQWEEEGSQPPHFGKMECFIVGGTNEAFRGAKIQRENVALLRQCQILKQESLDNPVKSNAFNLELKTSLLEVNNTSKQVADVMLRFRHRLSLSGVSCRNKKNASHNKSNLGSRFLRQF